MQRVRVEWKLTGIRQTLYKQQTNNRQTTDTQLTGNKQTRDRQETGRNRQATPLAYMPCQRFKASCASYADGSLRLLCAPECISGFHTAETFHSCPKREHQREHLSRFKAETWPRCPCLVVFCRISGTARSNLTVKATEVFRQVCQSNCKTTGFLRWSAKPIACSACFVVLKRPHNRGYLWPSCIKTIVRPE